MKSCETDTTDTTDHIHRITIEARREALRDELDAVYSDTIHWMQYTLG